MPSDSRAPPPPKIDDSDSSFADVGSEHLRTESVETADDIADETSQEISETADEASHEISEAADKTKKKSSDYMQTAKEKASEASKYSKEKGSELADKAGDQYDRAKKRTATNAKEAKKEIKSAGQDISENRDNPVVVANGVLLVLGSAALGYGAYTKHMAGELDWKLVGMTAAAVGVLAIADYHVSQYLFQNKYPKK